MRLHRVRGIPALACAAVLAAAGCSPGAEPQRPEDAAVVDVNPAPRGDIADGGTLDWGVNDFPAQWNPHHPDGRTVTVSTVAEAVLPRPFEVDAEKGPRPDPDYVLSADTGTERGQQVLTLELNPDAQWSDGSPVDWEDYRATARALSGVGEGFPVAGSIGYDRIAAVERGADDFEVRVVFDEPFSEYPALFAPLLPARYASDPDQFADAFQGDIPVTAGPFAFDGIDTARQTISLVRSGDWWGEPAKLDGIVFRAMDAPALSTAFRDGDIDTYTLPLDAADYEKAAAAGDGEVRTALGADYRHLTLNGESPRLEDVRARHAVFLGIDRTAVADAALSGVGWQDEPLDHRFVLKGAPWTGTPAPSPSEKGGGPGHSDPSGNGAGADEGRAPAEGQDGPAGGGDAPESGGGAGTAGSGGAGGEPAGGAGAGAEGGSGGGPSGSEGGGSAVGAGGAAEWGAYDPERARALLDEAGWRLPGGAGKDGGSPDDAPVRRNADGDPLELRFVVPRGFAPAQQEAELIQGMLAEIGVGVDIVPVGGDELFSRYVIPGEYDLVAFVTVGGAYPLVGSMDQWASPPDGPPTAAGGPNWRANVGRIASAEIDASLEDALSALDPDAARTALDRADRLLWNAGHTLPLYQRPQLTAARTTLANTGSPGFATLSYEDIGFLDQ
ncbi:ABC transporter family substrate-binding protein [Nocardiopsis coralliicola]